MKEESARLQLKSLSIVSQTPDAGEREGTVMYDATFKANIGESQHELVVRVTTAEGWETARHLACEQIKAAADALKVQAEREKTGPHIQQLF